MEEMEDRVKRLRARREALRTKDAITNNEPVVQQSELPFDTTPWRIPHPISLDEKTTDHTIFQHYVPIVAQLVLQECPDCKREDPIFMALLQPWNQVAPLPWTPRRNCQGPNAAFVLLFQANTFRRQERRH